MPEPTTTDDLPVLLVGDVHGDLRGLFPAIVPYDPTRWHTVFVGDLVDGGDFGVGALRFARDRPNTTVLLGNHEIAMLAALDDRQRRGDAFVRWVGIGGQLHDLQALAADEPLQAWLRMLPALHLLRDGTLVQHSDNDGLGRLVDRRADAPVPAVNLAVHEAIAARQYQLLWDLLTPPHVFERQPLRLARWLERTGARRVVHGHTPHRDRAIRVYAGGRAINVDGGFARRAHGARESVAPLPP
ncbi:MAG: metallophosphoesterase [Candidatus Dormibacteraceae bacterium]